MHFEFATANRIVFGPDCSRHAGALAREFGRRALVVVGRNADRAAPLLRNLAEAGLEATIFRVAGEPTANDATEGARLAREAGCELAVGFGGGSVIDAAKSVAALMTNSGDLFDYLEVIGRGRPLANPSAPCIAIPTTAGTGAEATRNAVLGSPEHRVKVSLRSPHMLPRLALVDPLLTHSAPPTVSAASGLDAISQLLEAFVSVRANPMTDALCREGLALAARSLRRAFDNGQDGEARSGMALASLFSGIVLANAGLGAVHGFAGPLGGMFAAPHGALCARLLPAVMDANICALRERAPGGGVLERYAEIARILLRRSDADAAAGVAWVRTLCRDLEVPPLAAHGLRETDFPAVIAKARNASSMKGNPIVLNDGELHEILAAAL